MYLKQMPLTELIIILSVAAAADVACFLYLYKIKKKRGGGIASVCAITLWALFTCIMTVFKAPDLLTVIKTLLLLAAVTVLAITDFYEKIIPNQIVILMPAVGILLFAAEWFFNKNFPLQSAADALLGAVIGGGVMLLSMLVSRGGVGGGDVKLFTCIGLYVGTDLIFTTLLCTFFLSAVSGLALIIFKKAHMRDSLPMAPFALAGCVLGSVLMLF